MTRGIRGAIQVEENKAASILKAAEELMHALIEANAIHSNTVAAVMFTVTPDINAVFPAEVRKKIGWELVPFLCAQEIPVPESLPRILRVLVLVDTQLSQREVRHQYLGAAQTLRPDLKR
ncbi:MAG: chorismate mutase [Acidobacteria bacterium]|nr:MAG: chorismate mutase [Acidobacteriota bacterium]